jgi:hypothetical protein
MIKTLFIKFLNIFKSKRDGGQLIEMYGVYKDEEDKRDFPIVGAVFPILNKELPKTYILPIETSKYIKNQGQWNSCASHAICTAVEISHDINKTRLSTIPLSERYHYYKVRQPGFQNNFPNNEGQTARNMMRIAQEVGIAPERLCPYLSSDMNKKPGDFAEGFASLWKVEYYYRIYDQDNKVELLKRTSILFLSSCKSFK